MRHLSLNRLLRGLRALARAGPAGVSSSTSTRRRCAGTAESTSGSLSTWRTTWWPTRRGRCSSRRSIQCPGHGCTRTRCPRRLACSATTPALDATFYTRRPVTSAAMNAIDRGLVEPDRDVVVHGTGCYADSDMEPLCGDALTEVADVAASPPRWASDSPRRPWVDRRHDVPCRPSPGLQRTLHVPEEAEVRLLAGEVQPVGEWRAEPAPDRGDLAG